ncbi:hypothetical protein ACI65C_006301 [Semiaphis heraclei]
MATINTGQGFTQLDTMAAFLNMPSISNMTYQKIHFDISNHTEVTAIEAMILAGNEEAEIAKKEGNVNENGVPLITVIADGAWCAITEAIKYRKNMTVHHDEKVELLKHDKLNSPYHVFGEHVNCAKYFCTGPKEGETNLVPRMDKCGLFKDILGARNIVAHHAQSLIYNVNNNAVEGFNSVVAKYVDGKRVNFSSRDISCSSVYRILHQNSYHPYKIHYVQGLKPTDPNRRLDFISKITFPKRTKNIDGPDEHYGAVEELGCAIIDMLDDEYLKEKNKFLNSLKLTMNEIVELERRTIGQQNNSDWQTYRKSRLTASNFGKVCKLRPSTSRVNAVKSILYDIFQGNSATRYGIENEPMAKRNFEKIFNLSIQPAGLFIHGTFNHLAASPDGLTRSLSDDPYVVHGLFLD